MTTGIPTPTAAQWREDTATQLRRHIAVLAMRLGAEDRIKRAAEHVERAARELERG